MKKRLFSHPENWLFVLLAACLFMFLPASAAQAATLRIPSGLTKIEVQEFCGDTGLDEVIIPEGVEAIESEAFAGTGIKTIALPISLNSIADDAFTGCDGMVVKAHLGSYAYTWAVEHEYDVVENNEPAKETVVYAPETLTAGKNLTVQVVGTANTIHQSIYITDETTGEYQSWQLYEPSGSATFYGYFFETGKTYRLAVYTVTKEFQTLTPYIKRIRVTGQKPEAPVFTLPESVTIGETYWINMGKYNYIQQKREIYSKDGELISKDETWEPNVSIYGLPDAIDRGTIKISYSACKDGIWSEWSRKYSVAFSLPQCLVGEVVLPDTIENGSEFDIQFEYANNPYFCYGYLYPEGSKDSCYSWYRYLYDDESGTVSMELFTPDFEPGKYTFKLCFNSGNGFESLAAQKDFEIVGTRAEAPVVTCDNTEILAESNAFFTITTPGAEAVKVKTIYPEGDDGTDTFSAQGDVTRWSRNCYSVGTYTYRFSVLKNGKWSDWSNPIEIHVRRKPKLDPATIHVSSDVTTGQDLQFSFDEVVNAEYYEIRFMKAYDSNPVYYFSKRLAIPGTELTIPGYLFSAGQYKITVSAYADEYAESTSEERITVRGTRPAGPDFIVEKFPCINSDTVFSANTENAELLVVKYQITKDDDWYENDTQIINVTGDTTQWTHYFDEYYEGRIFNVSFAVKGNGIWSDWSTGSYEILGLSPLDPAVIHIPDNIEAGKDFTITVDPVENATEYDYWIYQTGNDRAILSDSRNDLTDGIYIGGYELDPGEYTIKVRAYSDEYVTSESEESFTITGTKEDAPNVTVDKTEVYTGETLTFTIDTSEVALLCITDQWHNFRLISTTEDITKWSYGYGEAIELDYQFAVFKENKWSAWTEPIHIVIKDRPELSAPEIQASESMTAGSDFIFRFSPVENATSYSVSFSYPYNNAVIYNLDYRTALPNTDLTIPGYLLNPGNYVLTVTAKADGYKSATKTIRLSATGSRPAGPEITVEEPLRIKSTACFSINTEGAEALQLSYKYTYHDGGYSDESTSIPVAGDITQWLLQIDEYKEGVNLTVSFSAKIDGIWSAWRTYNYTIAGLPPLDLAVIHVDDTIEAGRDFSITVDPVENAASYEYRLYKSDGSSTGRSYYSSPIGELNFSGIDSDPGEYTIEVWAYSNDYATSISEKTFSVIGTKPDAPTVSVDKETVRANERFTFTIDTSNAEGIYYRISNYDYGFINVLEDETEWTISIWDSGNHDCCFAVKRDGIWSAWSDPITITVTPNPAPEDPEAPDSPEISVISPLESGRDLVIALSAVENAASYYISIEKADGTFSYSNSVSPENIGAYSILGYRITSGQYTIKAYARNGNVYSETVQKTVTIVSAERPAAPSVIPPENTVVPSDTYITFTIDTTGADMIAVRYFTVGNTNGISYNTKTVENGQDNTSWSNWFYGPSRKYSFAVRKDGVWSEWSGFTTITLSDD